jgi:hypothetical protein
MIISDGIFNPQNTLNYQTAQALLRLFDECYKRGVAAAVIMNDSNVSLEFVEQHRQSGMYATLCNIDRFGRITDGSKFTTQQWRTRIAVWADEYTQSYKKIMNWYLDRARYLGNYPAVVYPITMDFYLKGIYDFANNEEANIDVFMSTAKMTLEAGKKRIQTSEDYVREVQNFCFERAEMAKKNLGDGRILEKLTPDSYDLFSRVFWQCISGIKEIRRTRAKARLRKKHQEWKEALRARKEALKARKKNKK